MKILGVLLFTNVLLANGFDPTLIGGDPVKPGEYPEEVRISSCDKHNECAWCSATVVGEQAVLTAGHCIMPTNKISFYFEQNKYDATCQVHPIYADTEYNMDMALCKTDKVVPVKYAHISKIPAKKGDIVTMIGYGCTDSDGNGGNDGILRVGEAPVVDLPTSEKRYSWYDTTASTALCYGDSGGGNFRRVLDAKNDTHYVQGVNSRGDIERISMMTAIYLKSGVDFMQQWEKENNAPICGMSAHCSKDEQDKEEDKNVCKYQRKKVSYYEKKLKVWKDKLEQCKLDPTAFEIEEFN